MSSRSSSSKTQPPNTSPDPVTGWAKAVLAGEVVAGPHIRNAARRHLLDLVEGPKRGLTWDLVAAQRAIGFFPDVLRLAGGQFEGRTFELHPSQQFKVGSIFGWKRADGTRRFRRAYVEEAKGNGKTPFSAGIGHYCLMADGEARAEVYAAAANQAQAMVLFRDAVAMRDQSPELAARLTTSGNNPVWNLADLRTNSFFRPITGEVRRSGSGPRPSCALCDEVHEHPDGLTIEMLERGFKWRKQPLLVMTTNSGSDRNSACWQEHQHAVRVAAGTRTPDDAATFVGEVIDDETFSFVCGLDVDDDPLEDPSCWVKANPLLGVTVQPDYLAGVARQARSIPGKLNGILRLHFCCWTDAETAWMSRAALEAVLVDFDPLEHTGEVIAIGLDIGATKDMTALACVLQTGTVDVTRRDRDGVEQVMSLPTYRAWTEQWTPAETLPERALRDQAPYDVWVEEGDLNTTPGNVVRLDFVAARVAELQADYQIKVLAYDAYAFQKHLVPQLDEMGVYCPLVEHPQGGKRRAAPNAEQRSIAENEGKEAHGLWMPGSLAELETLILEGRIEIRSNRATISAIMSAAIEHDPFDNRWFSKRRAKNRIDALVALATAIGAATAQSETVIRLETVIA
jgi:phage terminase large subunit-like protein